jgi:hypothetical protein
MKIHALIIIALLTGCVAPEPIIADLEDDKVQVLYNGTDNAALMATANEGCAIHGRKAVGPLSERTVSTGYYTSERYYLFACK